jgi:hypothetical protein
MWSRKERESVLERSIRRSKDYRTLEAIAKMGGFSVDKCAKLEFAARQEMRRRNSGENQCS